MKRTTFRLSALALTIASLLGACTLIAEVDRSKIAEEVPDGMAGAMGTGGDGLGGAEGDGGAGGDAN